MGMSLHDACTSITQMRIIFQENLRHLLDKQQNYELRMLSFRQLPLSLETSIGPGIWTLLGWAVV